MTDNSMTHQGRFIPSTTLSNNDSLLIALLVAVIVHVVVILGVNFTLPNPEKVSRSIEVTLVNAPAKKAPKEAKFLAPDNQQGAGVKNIKPQPPAQKLPSNGNNSGKKPITKQTQETSAPKVAHKLLTRQKAELKVIAAGKPAIVDAQEERPHLSAETLQQQLMQLGTEIRQGQQSGEDTDIKFVSEVSAHKYVAAQYLKDWESKVERIGNLNYPEVAAKKNFSGTLTMDVTINADGSLHDIIIKRSSGNQALDDAAKRIVRMSAPFAPLPLDLLKELNPKILGITRIWKFSDESMTAR
ncbi:MAG: TonB family protein [Methylovulum sp.]|nr:TonB family protein [Methylovulum sp.]